MMNNVKGNKYIESCRFCLEIRKFLINWEIAIKMGEV